MCRVFDAHPRSRARISPARRASRTFASNAPSSAEMRGQGWRYITFQVFKVDQEHARVLAQGGQEAMPPTTLGTTARISMIRDPDGNWIELSQRASITGSLD